jgi:glycosyltransferase involved in cell wall biosynthesis
MNRQRPTLIYIFNTEYPNNKAHSIQITKTLYSLKDNFNIYCIVNKLNIPSHFKADRQQLNKISHLVNQKILQQYNYDLNSIKFIQIPKRKLIGINFFFTIYKLNKIIPQNSIFYTRSYNLARRLIKSKFLHHKKIILESHKKDGYYKEEQLKTKTNYTRLRQDYEKNNISKTKLQRIYSQVNMVLFTSKNSQKIVKKDLCLKNSDFIWYPIDSKHDFINKSKHIVYVGSLHSSKLIDLLLDALMDVQNINLDIYGGTTDDHNRLIQKAMKKNVARQINCHKFVPYSQLHNILKDYKFGVAMVEGIKVVDYLECGVIPIIPRIATYTDIFDEDTVIYYQPDNPKDLALKLKQANQFTVSIDKLKSIREFYSIVNFGKRLSHTISSI